LWLIFRRPAVRIPYIGKMPKGLKRYGQEHLHFLTCGCYRRQPRLDPARGLKVHPTQPRVGNGPPFAKSAKDGPPGAYTRAEKVGHPAL